jgi:hypothetical protein
MTGGVLLTVDFAHPPMRPEEVERALAAAIGDVRSGATLRVLKIIHGWGSRGRGGSTQDTVRNWLFRHGGNLRGVIEGEQFASLDPRVRDLLLEVDLSADPDLNRFNRGITIVWVR